MSAAGGFPATDVTGRMAMFGRLFGEDVGVPEPSMLPNATELVALVKGRVPRSGVAAEAPLVEAAAYVGEWLRSQCDALWIAEGPREPLLQVVDGSRAIVHLIPVVQLLRTASSAGYDGLARLLDEILRDVSNPAVPSDLDELRVVPDAERAAVVAWLERYHGLRDATRAALWRRCHTCSSAQEDGLTMHSVADDWESEAAVAAGILARRPFRCPCGGPPGELTRFLMVRADEDGQRFCEIRASSAASRVACWRVEGGRVIPFDATTFRAEGPGF